MNGIGKKFVIGLTGLGLSLSAVTAEEWRFNNFLPETRPESRELEQFVKEVNVALDGETKIKLYSGGSLGLPNRLAMVSVLPLESSTSRPLPSFFFSVILHRAQVSGLLFPGLNKVKQQLKRLLERPLHHCALEPLQLVLDRQSRPGTAYRTSILAYRSWEPRLSEYSWEPRFDRRYRQNS